MRKRVTVILVIFLWLGLTVFAWFVPSKTLSQAERRPLAQMPKISADNLLNGSFMGKFEEYTLDQFPMRDTFRSLKSLFCYYVLQMGDNNGIYMADGYAGKLEYPLNPVSISHALKKFNAIYEQYLQNTDSKIYMTIVPDKGYYLAAANGYPAMDYETLFANMAEGMPWAQIVDITKDLDITDYYRTDTHWRQENLLKVAQTLCDALGVTPPKAESFTRVLATQQFHGVYYGQAALPMAAEELYILENDLLSACRVYNHETGAYGTVYDMAKLTGSDSYEVYLSGAQALLTIENPNATTQRELIVFRDSFASSLVPLLIEDYKTVTMVDIRYVQSAMLEKFVPFHGQDVLFAYSTLLLNSSSTLK